MMNSILDKGYQCLLYLASPLLIVYLLLKTRHHKGRPWRHWLGYYPKPQKTGSLWLHAASLGEVNAAAPLIEALLTRYPDRPILISTLSYTGGCRVRALFGDRVRQVFLPLDFSHSVKRFFNTFGPSLAIIMETELWPELLRQCTERNIPIILANARLAIASGNPRIRLIHRLFKALIRPTLSKISAVLAQTQTHADRYAALGVPRERIQIAGNLKWEKTTEDKPKEQTVFWQRCLRVGLRPIWVAGSTHPAEESLILKAFNILKAEKPELLLILVPRHMCRSLTLPAEIRDHGFTYALRSQIQQHSATFAQDILLIDTFGELEFFYGMADLAFVGGSLVPIGGHDPLEPARLGLPVLIGPHHQHCEDSVDLLKQAGACLVVSDSQDLASTLLGLIQNKNQIKTMGLAAKKTIGLHQGAVFKHTTCIHHWLMTQLEPD